MPIKIIAAGGLVYNPQGAILFMYRRGKWDLPKGKLDEGETIEACAVREVEEETGLKNIELVQFIDITNHEYTIDNVQYQKETHWYTMRVNGEQTLVPQTEEDILELKWVEKSDLQTYLANSYENIREIIAKAAV
jgi:8-oxo-dGTP pyrophosphatase MutT (NUDIX family)